MLDCHQITRGALKFIKAEIYPLNLHRIMPAKGGLVVVLGGAQPRRTVIPEARGAMATWPLADLLSEYGVAKSQEIREMHVVSPEIATATSWPRNDVVIPSPHCNPPW